MLRFEVGFEGRRGDRGDAGDAGDAGEITSLPSLHSPSSSLYVQSLSPPGDRYDAN
jgi:hypothetical protein